MKKIIGLVFLSLLAISASAADLIASFAPPVVTQNIVVEGAACPGFGATGFSSTGLLLSCQSGVWRSLGGRAIASLGNPGWSCDPSTGKIEQWGSGGALVNDGTRWEYFPRVMAAVYNASVTAINLPSGSRRGGDMAAYYLSTDRMLVVNDDYAIDGYYWRVIGYVSSCT